MKISVDLKISNYTGNYSNHNTIGNKYKTGYINVLDLYRHALANTSHELFSLENIKRYGWRSVCHYGIERSLSRVDDIFSIGMKFGINFLESNNYYKFSNNNFHCINNGSVNGVKFLMDLCAELHGPDEQRDIFIPRLIRNPLSKFEIGDKTRDESYHAGMIFSRLYAEKVFNIPFLTHLKDAKKSYAISTSNGLEPDLVGLDKNLQWHAFEAKGTTNNSYLYSGLRKAKKQLQSLRSINKDPNIIRTACGTLYTEETVRTLMRDPEPTGEVEINIDILNSILSHYKYINLDQTILVGNRYKPNRSGFIDLLDLKISNIPISFSLHAEIFSVLKEAKLISVRNPLPYKQEKQGDKQLNNFSHLKELNEAIFNRNRLCKDIMSELYSTCEFINRVNDEVESDYLKSSVGLDGFRLDYQY